MKQLVLYMLTCNILQKRPVTGTDNFWPFQYVEENKVEGELVYSPDFFTEKALEFVQRNTVRETLGLTFKDVLNMDYGMFLYLDKIVNNLEDARRKALEDLDKQTRGTDNE